MGEELLLALALGCDRVSSLEGSLVAGTGMMAVVAVPAALAVSAVKHRSAQYCACLAAAQCCSFMYCCCSSKYWTWRCGARRCSSGVIRSVYPGTNTLAVVAANRSRRLTSISRVVAAAAAS